MPMAALLCGRQCLFSICHQARYVRLLRGRFETRGIIRQVVWPGPRSRDRGSVRNSPLRIDSSLRSCTNKRYFGRHRLFCIVSFKFYKRICVLLVSTAKAGPHALL